MGDTRRKEKQREQKVKEKLREWLKRNHSKWFIAPTSIRKPLAPYEQRMLSPDVDVLAYYKGPKDADKLIAFETKAPVERYKTDYRSATMYQLYKCEYISKLLKQQRIETGRGVAGLKYNLIYEGIGQALFHLRWADKSFLVLPELRSFYMVDPFQTIILHVLYEKLLSIELPIGLIEYDFRVRKGQMKIGEFRYAYEAKGSYLWQEPSAKFPEESCKDLYRDEILQLREDLKERCLSRKSKTKRRN